MIEPPAGTPPADRVAARRPAYVPAAPALEIPVPAAIRAELQEMVIKDLLGPAGGPEEEIDEPFIHVYERYVVGTLAPQQRLLEPEELDEPADAVPGGGEDGATDTGTLASATMFPSSIGLSFCVDAAVGALRVSVRWGWYRRAASDSALNPKTGNPLRIWKRTPVDATTTLDLDSGRLEDWVPNEEQPQVVVRGLARRPAANGRRTITLFLINGQKEPNANRDESWLFQPELTVEGTQYAPLFLRCHARRQRGRLDESVFTEMQDLEMLYRGQPEFAAGHGVSVHADLSPDEPARALRLSTRIVPRAELPRTGSVTEEDVPALSGLALDMKLLAGIPDRELDAALGPLASAYGDWIAAERRRIDDPSSGLTDYQEAAERALSHCETARERIAAGLRLLSTDPLAAEAFRFMNRAMWGQRIHTRLAEEARRGSARTVDELDVPEARTWYPFQIAFILLNLPGITDLAHPDRSPSADATADLLWFPTGGGKTEAYLGLTAYILALRRLQGPVAGRSGEHGVAVLMRYTLRLLTLQQFQRAAALLCACEDIRREAADAGDGRWGREPFRLGLWVGARTTPNRFEDSAEAIQQHHGQGYTGGLGDPAQLTYCPWCGCPIDRGRDIRADKPRRRTLIYCGDPLGRCLFSARRSPGEGLPVLVVDEEIYRLLPSLLLATVDKFAQMPWNGMVEALFGRVDGLCPRHGFRTPDMEDSDSHPRAGDLPAVKTQPHSPLRPPDLIIQDELHLISGPLGSLVGHYETAVDYLSTWSVDGHPVRPKVIASTATIRNAAAQVGRLFVRRVSVFPPHGLDARDNFFALQRPPDAQNPGRLYLGICAPGKRLKAVVIRVYVAYLSAGWRLFEKYGAAADPWLTLVGYFNSMRELGGTRRLVDDDIRTRLLQMDRRGLAKRRPPDVQELTSRMHSSDIPRVLDRLEVAFDPAAEAQRRQRRGAADRTAITYPIDILLATNMLSVGVDVKRLGLMVVAGQPKTTAEYIQATSRVGRARPGVVCTILNWARPRDLSHYEQFEHYHSTFYQHVEALSVTPFASRAVDRGLAALLVAAVRNAGAELNANSAAAAINPAHPQVRAAVESIVQRAEDAGSPAAAGRVRQELQDLLEGWRARAGDTTGGQRLGYESRSDGLTVSLLQRPGAGVWDPFTCLNSLRDVEPVVNLVLDDHGLDVTTWEDQGPAASDDGTDEEETL